MGKVASDNCIIYPTGGKWHEQSQILCVRQRTSEQKTNVFSADLFVFAFWNNLQILVQLYYPYLDGFIPISYFSIILN